MSLIRFDAEIHGSVERRITVGAVQTAARLARDDHPGHLGLPASLLEDVAKRIANSIRTGLTLAQRHCDKMLLVRESGGNWTLSLP